MEANGEQNSGGQDSEAVYMVEFNEQTGGYQMTPQWISFWMQRLAFYSELWQYNPPHITEELRQAYYKYLTDVMTYINGYVLTCQIADYKQYQQIMKDYRASANPDGAKIYDKQEAYYYKMFSGDETKVRNAKVPPTKQTKEKPKEDVQPVRRDDPKIDHEGLLAAQYNKTKYPTAGELCKPNVNLIFIGHVDAGKSTLSGRILKNLKLVDEQELKKNEQEAKQLNRAGWELAYITDNIPDEKAKGKTVECSKTIFALSKRRFTLFDAPGHRNYVPNMIIGACQADLAVLIISAKAGEYESGFDKDGQTKEHAMLARALGVHTLFCVVTKMREVQWSQERYNKISSDVSAYLKASCGYENVEFIPIDSIADINIDSRNYEPVCKWYKGPCLFEKLDSVSVEKKDIKAPLRIPVTDKFKDQGHLYVYGKVESGTVIEDQSVSLLPSQKYFDVKEIFNAKDERLPYAMAGENVKIKVKFIEEQDIERGNIICNNQNFCLVCYQFQAVLNVLELPEKKVLSEGSQCVIHLHAVVSSAEIAGVLAVENPENKKMLKGSFLRSGQKGIVKIKVNTEVCLENFNFMESLGRFTLRSENKTIAYGEVTKVKPSQNQTAEQKTQAMTGGSGNPVDKLKQETEAKLKIQQ